MKKKERMGFISLFIFLILSAFVLVCLESGLIIHAEENTTLGEIYGYDFAERGYFTETGYRNSALNDSSLNFDNYSFRGTTTNNNGQFIASNAEMLGNIVLPSSIDTSLYANFFIWSQNSGLGNTIWVYLTPSNTVACSGNNCAIIGYPQDADYRKYCALKYNYTSNGYVYSSNGSVINGDIYSEKTDILYRYIAIATRSTEGYFIASNMPYVVSCINSVDEFGCYKYGCVPFFNNGSFSSSFKNLNYPLYDAQGGFDYYNPIDGSGTPPTDYSNVYDSTTLFDGSVMYITNTTFNDGTFYIYPVFNNTQKENLDKFKLRLVGSCQYVCHKEDGLDKQIMKYNNVWLSTYYGIPASGKTFSCSLRSDYGNYWDIPFNSISGGVYSAKLSAINNAMYYSGGDYPIEGLASCLSSYYGGYFVPFTQALNHVASNITGGSLPVASENGNVTITGCTYHFDLYVVSTVNGEEVMSDSPVMNYDIDMINGTINGTSFDNLTDIDDLNDAYDNNVPQSSYPSSSPSTNYGGSFNNYDNTTSNPGGGSGGGGSSSSGGSVVNNNSDTLTINGNGEVAKDIVNDLIPTDGVGGFTEQIEQTLQANSWMQVVKNTFAFIPAAVFTQISLYIITVLGILAAAFVLRIVLDLL